MSTSRRGFLKGVAAGALAASSAKAGSTEHFSGYAGRYGLLHDTTLCIGCRSCEFACNEVNGLPAPETPINDKKIFSEKRGTSEKLYTVVNSYGSAGIFRKHQCMHCNEPCCASVCFVNAFTKTPEGPVLYDPDVCVGCRYCVFACPYYALAYEYDDPVTPRVVRCTMCYPRIKEGKIPACAEACPTGAIQFGRRDELIQVAHKRFDKYPDRYVKHIFGEHEWGGTSWLTLAGVPFEQLGLPKDPTLEPLPNLTTGFLSLAPIVAAIFPGLLAGMYAFTKRKEQLAEDEKGKLLADAEARAEERLTEVVQKGEERAEREAEYEARAAEKTLKDKQQSAKEGSDTGKEESR